MSNLISRDHCTLSGDVQDDERGKCLVQKKGEHKMRINSLIDMQISVYRYSTFICAIISSKTFTNLFTFYLHSIYIAV